MQTRHEKPSGASGRRRALLGPVAIRFESIRTGTWRVQRPRIAASLCNGCGMCHLHCPPDVIEIHRGAVEPVVIDWEYCKGCGICANVCPKDCIRMVEEQGTDEV